MTEIKKDLFTTIRLNETMNNKRLTVDNFMSYIRTQLICKIQSQNNENYLVKVWRTKRQNLLVSYYLIQRKLNFRNELTVLTRELPMLNNSVGIRPFTCNVGP